MGGIVQGDGPNQKTEPDTTIFDQVKIATDGLGRTNAGGANTVAKVADTMVLSGPVLPQGSATKGHCNGIWHTVVTDGAGPVRVMIDPTATGKFSTGTEATVTIQVPGKGGEIPPPKQRRFLPRTLIKMGLLKRASNVDEDSVSFFLPNLIITIILTSQIAHRLRYPRWHYLHWCRCRPSKGLLCKDSQR